MNKPNQPETNPKAGIGSPSKDWHPNAPMNPNTKAAQPQPESTPDPDSAKLIPPVLESDDSLEHQWRASDTDKESDDNQR